MKTIIPIIVLLFSFICENKSQFFGFDRDKPSNALYLAYQPWDHGIGLRYDHHVWKMGLYSSATYGSWGLYKQSGLTNHVKLSAGILIPLADYIGYQYDISLAANRHFVDYEWIDDYAGVYNYDKIASRPWSFEIGLTIKMRRFTLGCRTDILHWEPCIDIGIPLTFKPELCRTYK